MNQQQITLDPPNRETMRLVFELALKSATSQGTRQSISNAYQYHEVLWLYQDQQQEEAKSAADEKPPKGSSAVEKHGVDSPQAKSARGRRKAKREAAKEPADGET